MSTSDGAGPGSGNSDLLIHDEMKESYLAYAMSVLVDRALPDIRDGLKPVHRRILQTLRDLNLLPGRKHLKSAKIVGDCLGNYHPHGDSAVYDAMVRMAQDFSLRYALVDGQGNFGSIDGDAAAAYRYTEARMAGPAIEMLEDIQYETVDTRPTYDGRMTEPTVLPAQLPNLLVNGSSGIAVGMATNIPPHNLREICAAIATVIDRPDCTVEDLLQHVRGPDFPTGAVLCGTHTLRQAYETGRGRVTVRARIERETIDGRDALVVSEIPYGIKLSTVYESIQAAHSEEKIPGLQAMNGGVVGDGIRLVLSVKKGEDADLVLNQLWEHTNLQYHFAINMIALDGGRPRTVSLKRMCQAWIDHRQEVIVRRTRFLLDRDEARLHIVQGLLAAIDVIDAIITLIRAAASVEQAKEQLVGQLQFSERQAQAILEMQLRRLTGLERGKLTDEANALMAAITDYKDILARVERRNAMIKDDLARLVEKYGDERRTDIGPPVGDFDIEDLIEDAPCIVTVTASGYIKRMPSDTFRLQRRGGKGVAGGQLKDDEDSVAKVFAATNHQYLLVFTSHGRCHWLKVYQVPEAARTARGKHLANLLSIDEGERVTEIIPVREFSDDRFLLMATRQGQVKKTELSAYGNPRQGGIKAIKLAEGDDLVDVVITGGDDQVLLAADDGKACRWHESDCRPTGRDTSGVCGIDLNPGAQVVSLLRLEPGLEVLTICRNGFGKRTPYEEYRLVSRGGKGVINIDTGERNGPVVASLGVREDDEIMLLTAKGQAVRTAVAQIRSTARAALGVTIIDLDEGDAVSGVAVCPKGPETAGAAPADPA